MHDTQAPPKTRSNGRAARNRFFWLVPNKREQDLVYSMNNCLWHVKDRSLIPEGAQAQSVYKQGSTLQDRDREDHSLIFVLNLWMSGSQSGKTEFPTRHPRTVKQSDVHFKWTGRSERDFQGPKRRPSVLSKLSFAPVALAKRSQTSNKVSKLASSMTKHVVSSAYWRIFTVSPFGNGKP